MFLLLNSSAYWQQMLHATSRNTRTYTAKSNVVWGASQTFKFVVRAAFDGSTELRGSGELAEVRTGTAGYQMI